MEIFLVIVMFGGDNSNIDIDLQSYGSLGEGGLSINSLSPPPKKKKKKLIYAAFDNLSSWPLISPYPLPSTIYTQLPISLRDN